jgi:hypothetical protein
MKKVDAVVFQGEITSAKRMATGVCRIQVDIYEKDIDSFQKLNSQLYYLKPLNIVVTPIPAEVGMYG